MMPSRYYRDKAREARRLMGTVTREEVADLLQCIARDYDELAIDLEDGLIEILHPELLPQRRHS